MKKRIESFNAWLEARAWLGQPRAVVVFPALLIVIACLLYIIKRL